MTFAAQFPIYEYADGEVEKFVGEPPFSLPYRLKYDNKLYIYIDNPCAWVESNEYRRIVNSHNSSLPNFDPNSRVWIVYDALGEDTVIDLVVNKLIFLNGPDYMTREGYLKCIKQFLQFPTLYTQAIGEYQNALKAHKLSLSSYMRSLCNEIEV